MNGGNCLSELVNSVFSGADVTQLLPVGYSCSYDRIKPVIAESFLIAPNAEVKGPSNYYTESLGATFRIR